MLSGAEERTVGEWAAAAVPVQAAALDLALRGLPRPGRRAAFGMRDPLYLSVHSSVARLAPEDAAVVHVARYLGPSPHQAPEAIERELRGFADLVQPGWRQHVHHTRFYPTLAVVHALPLAGTGGLAGRPGPRVPGAAGLVVAGDWVGREGMLADGSVASGRAAAHALLSEVPRTLAASA
jgi:hypothetical protein